MALVEPSRPPSAYFIWLSENRDGLTKEAGTGKGSVIIKLAGEKWKALSASTKEPYEKMAADSKTAYEKAMEEFKAAGGEVGKRRQEKADAKQEKADKKARKEAKKNSGAPKRPTSAFWLWQTENREALVKEAGTTKIPVIGKLAGEKWGKLSAADKAPFEKRAETAKAEYTKAMEEWKAANPDPEPEKDGAAEGTDLALEAKRKRKAAAAPAVLEATPDKTQQAHEANKDKDAAPSAEKQKKARGAKRAKTESAKETYDPAFDAALKEAEKHGLFGALKNLAARPEIQKLELPASKVLSALREHDGLVNKTKAALLGA